MDHCTPTRWRAMRKTNKVTDDYTSPLLVLQHTVAPQSTIDAVGLAWPGHRGVASPLPKVVPWRWRRGGQNGAGAGRSVLNLVPWFEMHFCESFLQVCHRWSHWIGG